MEDREVVWEAVKVFSFVERESRVVEMDCSVGVEGVEGVASIFVLENLVLGLEGERWTL